MIFTFACSIASFIDNEWKLVEQIIDFRPLESQEHEGIYTAQAFIEGAWKAGVFKKISYLLYSAILKT